MERYGLVVEIKSSQIEEYERIHADVWPGVLATIADCNVHNYSIYRYNNLLFTYYEYHGSDWAADMAKMAADKTTQEWWAIMEPMQSPLPTRKEGEWWSAMEEVFHAD